VISEGWYVPQRAATRWPRSRWVLGARDGTICYSRGGDKHFFCNEETFNRWMRRWLAKPAKPGERVTPPDQLGEQS
jgi:hypothetical protein